MRIVYSHDIFSFQAYGGISRYFVEIAKRIPANEAQVQIFAGLYINQYLKGLPGLIGFKLPVLKNRGVTARIINASMYLMRKSINDLVQRALIRSDPQTILHLSYYTRPPAKKKLKLVVTVYDMIRELFGQYFPRDDRTIPLKRLCCEQADKIIAISNCTKKDLMDLLGVNDEKITVIYLGNPLENISPGEGKEVTQTPYVFYVGARGGYKNFDRLLQAFARVIVAPQGFRLDLFRRSVQSGRAEEIERLRTWTIASIRSAEVIPFWRAITNMHGLLFSRRCMRVLVFPCSRPWEWDVLFSVQTGGPSRRSLEMRESILIRRIWTICSLFWKRPYSMTPY